uniref:Uncharacterized protein n=1 Tax=Loa loa TaxID=7209 RepID=A0A1I7V6E6_LOALO
MTRLEEAERRLEEFEGRNAPEEMKEGSALEEPRTRMIKISVPATHTTLDTVIPEAFHPEDLGDLPEQLRRELELPEAESVRYLRQAIRYTKRVAHSRLDETQTGGFLCSLWPLPSIATRIYGRTENSSGRTSCARLVPEDMCSRNQRKTGDAPQILSCGKRKGCLSHFHS